jgi:hypothetical protein
MATPAQTIPPERLRLLYSLGDFQLALSAAAFLGELDEDAKYSKIELRRFRCYETTAIISYARPFSLSLGNVPRLTLAMTGAQLSDEQQALHERLMRLRNKVVAHSDAEMMRMRSHAAPMEIDSNFSYVFLHSVFDEGLTFVGMELVALNELLHIVFHSTYKNLLHEAQERPEEFNFLKDYLNQELSPDAADSSG